MSSPKRAPDYTLYRENVSAVDDIATKTLNDGILMNGYEYANVQIFCKNGADPTVQVYWYSEQGYVQEHTPLEFVGLGAEVPFEFSVNCRGRRMFVAVTNLPAGEVDVYVSGFNWESVG